MERVEVDVLGPFPHTEAGNRYVLVAMDYFTQWPEAYALLDQSAPTVADALLEGMFARLGVPEELHSDQGRNFESQVFARVCQRLGITKTRTTPLHPQSDGLVERFNQTLATQLATLVSRHQRDWDRHLPLALWAYRTTVQESTGCTPASLLLGREMRTPVDLVFGPPLGDGPAGPDYEWDLRHWMQRVHSFARTHLTQAGVRQKRYYDLRCRGPAFQPGDLVWVYNPCRRKGLSPKLAPSWEGPTEVLRVVGEVCYRVRLRTRGRVVVLHRDRLAPYRAREEEPCGEALEEQPGLEPADSGASVDRQPSPRHSGRSRRVPQQLAEYEYSLRGVFDVGETPDASGGGSVTPSPGGEEEAPLGARSTAGHAGSGSQGESEGQHDDQRLTLPV
uniref:Integrase catalytic domain-containing protein n=1 Tax=Lepisosteus oculatus TaxID=7918 RepID=W5NNZ4_LEPOC